MSDQEACGPNLEYDPEYVLLTAKMLPKSDIQYGDFIGAASTPDWAEIERDSRRILLRSRDITILILLMRCRVRLAQGAGLLEGLSLLVELLEAFPLQIHPQATGVDDPDILVRVNAMAAMADPDGLLNDIREMELIKKSALRLQVRDVERAHAIPRLPDALSVASLRQQLGDLVLQQNPTVLALAESLPLIVRIQHWNTHYLGDMAPDLSPLTQLIRLMHDEVSKHRVKPLPSARIENGTIVQKNPESASARPTVIASSGGVTGGEFHSSLHGTEHSESSELFMKCNNSCNHACNNVCNNGCNSVCNNVNNNRSTLPDAHNQILDRACALRHLMNVRIWFEQAEPSSPVSMLLRQAEKQVGKPYSDIVGCIPAELLLRWQADLMDQSDTSEK